MLNVLDNLAKDLLVPLNIALANNTRRMIEEVKSSRGYGFGIPHQTLLFSTPEEIDLLINTEVCRLEHQLRLAEAGKYEFAPRSPVFLSDLYFLTINTMVKKSEDTQKVWLIDFNSIHFFSSELTEHNCKIIQRDGYFDYEVAPIGYQYPSKYDLKGEDFSYTIEGAKLTIFVPSVILDGKPMELFATLY